MKPKKLITAIVLSSLALTGCGGGGGGGSSGAPPANNAPATPPLNNPAQLWAPFYSVTTVTGSPVAYGNLAVDSIVNPQTQVPIAPSSFDGKLTSLQNIDSSGMLASTDLGFTVEGIRYFLFSSNGKLYAVDLTSSSPVAIQWGSLGISQICGIQAEQFDGSGLTGDVIVSGVTSGTNCSSPNTWIVPFNTPATTAILPQSFHEFLVATFISATTSNINTTGYVIGVTTSTSSTVNYTTDPASIGTPITGIPPYSPSTDSLASDKGGNATHQFVWVYDHSNSPVTSTLYSVSNNGTATPVTGLPASNISNNTATDSTGNLYVVENGGTSSAFTVQVFKVPVTGGAAVSVSSVIPVGSSSTTSISTNISVNQLGTAGVLTVTAFVAGTSPAQTNQNLVLNLTNSSPASTIPGNNNIAMQFIGLDGSGVINATSTQNNVYAVNLGAGTNNSSLTNMTGISQLWSTNLLGLPNVDTVAYSSFLAQDSTGVVSVIETQHYQTTGQFNLPAGSPLFYPANLSSRPNYILGMELGTGGNLFAVIPAATPAVATVLHNNSTSTSGSVITSVFWNGY